MTPDVQRAIAELSAERQRRHAEVDRDCDRKLEAILRAGPSPLDPPQFVTLKVAAFALKVSERTAKRYAIKFRAGSQDSNGHWRVDVALIRHSIEVGHHRRAAFAG